MLELFGWNIGMNLGEAALLVSGALVIGVVAQAIGRTTVGFAWVVVALAALVGGWLGSEAFGTLSTWGPVIEGLYVLPALIGAVAAGAIADVAMLPYWGATVPEPRPV